MVVAVATLAACYSPRSLDASRAVELWRSEAPQYDAAAQPSVDELEGDAWTLAALALSRNPSMEASQARVTAAEAAIGAAGRFRDLELRITGARLDEFDKELPEVDVQVRYRPARPGSLASREDEARLAAEVVRAGADGARARVVAAVRRSHAEASLAEEARVGSEAEVALWAAHLEFVRRRAAASEATELDVQLAALEHAEAVDRVAERGQERDIALARLRELLDLPVTSPVKVAGAPGAVAPEPLDAADALIERALSERPETRAAAARIAAAEAASWRARAARWPWLGFVQLGYRATAEPTALDWGFGFSVDLPIFAWLGGEVSARDARVTSRRVEERSLVRGITRQVEVARARVEASRRRLDELEATLLVASDTALGAAHRAREGGVASAARELRLLASRARIRRRHLEARREWIGARIKLDEMVGLTGPR